MSHYTRCRVAMPPGSSTSRRTCADSTRSALPAAARQVEVLVTPEMFATGYAITRRGCLRLAEDAGGPTEAAVAEIARRHHLAIVYGYPERARDDSASKDGAYNAATMIGPDGVVRGAPQGAPLRRPGPRPVRRGRRAAGGVRLRWLPRWMLICYDVEFPEPCAAWRWAGADSIRADREHDRPVKRCRSCWCRRGLARTTAASCTRTTAR